MGSQKKIVISPQNRLAANIRILIKVGSINSLAMYLQLSCRRFRFSKKERSGLREGMRNKKIRYERREDSKKNRNATFL